MQKKFYKSTAAGKALIGMLSVLVEFERDIIRERTTAGLKAARARVVKMENQRLINKKLNQDIVLYHSKEWLKKKLRKLLG
ncbi:recombinase family protein [Bacillus sp. OV166]|uniref:recombinase family protein n=1 Tax=Bacillus sp. OV166 TaxID=1882763 RepID=UPI00211B6B33|nr:recombinase family protein [Bacillus sp. OV166]